MKPLVTVLILTYERERFFNEALESVQAQTYKNIQIICIDNGSKVPYIPMLESPHVSVYLPQRERFIGPNGETIGHISWGWNQGLKHAKGDYIVFLDDDTKMMPHRVETCIDFLKERPDVDILINQARGIDENSRDLGRCLFGKFGGFHPEMLKYHNFVDTCEVMLKNSPLVIYDENLMTHMELDIWLAHLQTGKKFYYLEKELSQYRIHANNNVRKTVRIGMESDRYLRKKYNLENYADREPPRR